MNAFDRYAPFIKDYIYQNSWQNLRGIQVAAAEAIFETDNHVLLCASTASGKTEAAFFPILTELYEQPSISVGAIYIGPLKALINDQFMRLNDLCLNADIPVWHWHGDVSASHKNKLLKNPSGILQITPESLQALLLRKHAYVNKLFCDLRYIVIDEVHSLMRGDRGGQTMCLIETLSRMADVNPRRVGLSATIGDVNLAGKFLSGNTGVATVIPQISEKTAKWRLSVEHFFISGAQEGDSESVPMEEKTDTAPRNADPAIGYIFEHTRGKKCLAFVNSREECEIVTTTLRQYCEYNNQADRFMIHHGNLSASYRETAETAMKDEEKCLTTVTTATLELGIDIGRLERAFQLNAPFTVSSFLQRMGRTGRRDLPPEMWFVMREETPEERAMLPVTLPWELLQAIALIEVYRDEKWVEPPRTDKLPYSLLYHQTMCTLFACGELSPASLASKVLTLATFAKISQEDYRCLLRHLIDIDHIQKTENGGLIVGLSGEREVNSFKFYAVFKENEEYTVRTKSEELGTIVMPPPIGEKIALAGHVWVVDDIDHKRHLVYCTKVKGKVPAYFGQCPGDINTKILLKMREILSVDKQYPYLMENARARLEHARTIARNASLASEDLICLGGDMYCYFPWLGTYAFLALERILKIKCAKELGISGVDSSRPYFIQFKMQATRSEFFAVLKAETQRDFEPLDLIYKGELPLFEKYDDFLPVELVKKGFAYGVLGIPEVKDKVSRFFHA